VKTLAEILLRSNDEGSSRPALVEPHRAVTYAELSERCFALALHLQEAGLEPGGTAGLLLPNGADFVTAYFAVLSAGGIVVPLNADYRVQEIRRFIRSCRLRLLVASRSHQALCEEVAALDRSEDLQCSFVFIEDWAFQEDRPRLSAARLPVAVSPEQPAMFQFSSGSTGLPKRIARTHAQLLWELEQLRTTLRFNPDDRFLGAAPFSHVNGLVRTMLSSLYARAALYPVPSFERRTVASLIEEHRLTTFIAVPFMFCMLAETRFSRPPDFSSLRWCISASAPMPVHLNQEFRRRYGRYVRQLYGSTETGTISVNLDPDPAESLASVGHPLPGFRVEVLADHGGPQGTLAEGEIAVAGPGAITGYEDLPEVNRESFRDGFFLTGDVGKKDAAGRIYLLGRKKFFINKGGYKINPQEIEDLLHHHPCVREAAVIGVPTAYEDEKVKAVIVPSAQVSPEDLVEFCRGRIADFKIPSLFEFREELPRSPTGKLRKKLLLEQDGNGHAAGGES